jgi:hypothetical protein
MKRLHHKAAAYVAINAAINNSFRKWAIIIVISIINGFSSASTTSYLSKKANGFVKFDHDHLVTLKLSLLQHSLYTYSRSPLTMKHVLPYHVIVHCSVAKLPFISWNGIGIS